MAKTGQKMRKISESASEERKAKHLHGIQRSIKNLLGKGFSRSDEKVRVLLGQAAVLQQTVIIHKGQQIRI